jgi:cytochrome c peroxidase
MRAALAALACALAACAAPGLRETQLRPTRGGFDWRLPPGFPVPAVPADNPMSDAKVELGRALFYERRLSVNGTLACAGCHQQARGFTDGRPRAIGATGERHPRSAMALANVAYNARFTWSDRRPRSLEEQMAQPLFNEHPVEMGLRSPASGAVRALAADRRYRELFRSAFPRDARPVRLANVVRAIASFERTLISGRSAFDRYFFDDDPAALDPAARRGMQLFFSARAGCSACHTGLTLGGARASYANTSVARGQRQAVRVPSLRNVEVTAPYMHDGSLATLEEVLQHYSAGGRYRSRYTDSRLRPIDLSPAERHDLIEFLDSLTDREFLADPRFAEPRP